jgi:hypothetical protein
VTAPALISRHRAVVKAHLLEHFSLQLDLLLDAADLDALGAREAEKQAWAAMLAVGQLVLTAMFAAMCRRATEGFLAPGRGVADVKMRMDRDYWMTVVTTMGKVRFPAFAFRFAGRVHVPARALFPLHRIVCASELCLEWETALAGDHPFRKAAVALGFFTHGAVDIEDTTLQRHAFLVGSNVTREWLYQPPAKIKEVLRDQATRDRRTGRPLVYASTDAHALRRFVDATWHAPWKMTNGIRLWCISQKTGETIHLGGEYTWGDCHEVARLFRALQESGHLPADGDYGDGVVAQVVLPTDGLDWIAEHVLPLFPDAEVPLDPYHVIQQVADAASTIFPRAKKKARRLVKQARRALGIRDRRGRTVRRKGPRRLLHRNRHVPFRGSGHDLLALLQPILKTLAGRARARWAQLIRYLTTSLHRMSYGDLRNAGYSVGSGAMESQHRFASQVRLKLAGARWTESVAQAMLNIRMLTVSGRWDEFWKQEKLPVWLAEAEATG